MNHKQLFILGGILIAPFLGYLGGAMLIENLPLSLIPSEVRISDSYTERINGKIVTGSLEDRTRDQLRTRDDWSRSWNQSENEPFCWSVAGSFCLGMVLITGGIRTMPNDS